MGNCFLHGNGGANPLNFRVVGGTAEPTNPKENTIWVNTSTEIFSWDFSATQPYRRSKNENLNVYPYYHTTRTENGLTFTDNKDGTVKVNGTATADTFFRIHYAKTDYVLELEPGTYTLSDVAGTSDGRCELLVSYDNQATWSTAAACNSGKMTFTLTEKAIGRIALKLYSGKTFSNLVFKPQLEKGSSATSFVKGDANGQVWITTGESSEVPFNALKKNGIHVYPLSAKQYVSGAWVDKTAKSYQNSAWVACWDGYLYNEGTFGKTLNAYAYKNSSSSSISKAPTVNNSSGEIKLDLTGTVSTGYAGSYFVDNVIDLTNYSKIAIQVTAVTCPLYASIRLLVVSKKADNFTIIAKASLESTGEKTLDVSSLNGNYYVCVELAGVEAKSVTFSKWWLE